MTTISADHANFTIPFGMEITIERLRRDLNCGWERLETIREAYHMQLAASSHFDSDFLYWCTVDSDDGVWEFKTGLVRNIYEAQLCYEAARDAYPRKRVCTQLNGGGGHLHAIQRKAAYTSRFRAALAFDLIERPYIGWSFLDPCDDAISATVLWKQTKDGPREYDDCDCESCREYRRRRARRDVKTFVDGLYHTKSSVLNWANMRNTDIELRFFGTPLSWPEQRAHLLFADAWLSRHAKLYQFGKRIPRLNRARATKPIESWTHAEALDAMHAYITRDLRLHWPVFEDMVERNLLNRFADSYGYIRT